MKLLVHFTILIFTLLLTLPSWAEPPQQENRARPERPNRPDHPGWAESLKENFSLTDAQIKSYQENGLQYPQIAMAAQLAKKSGKSIDEVIKMRTENRKDWGQIAKDLGVPPEEIGKGVKEIRANVRNKRMAERKARHEEQKKKLNDKNAESPAPEATPATPEKK